MVVFLSMAGIVLPSNIIGAGLPFLLNRPRLDPALASSPLITSVADVVAWPFTSSLPRNCWAL